MHGVNGVVGGAKSEGRFVHGGTVNASLQHRVNDIYGFMFQQAGKNIAGFRFRPDMLTFICANA